jgi:hypothetical protein
VSVLRAPAGSRVDADHTVSWAGQHDLPEALRERLRARGVEVVEAARAVRAIPRLSAVDSPKPGQAVRTDLEKRRVLVMHSNPEHASLLTWALAARGALARAVGTDASAREEVAPLAADVLLVDEQEFFDGCWDGIREMWSHPLLRWTPSLLLPLNLLETGSEHELDALCATVQELCVTYERCVAQAAAKKPFELSLGELGPARTLRALLEAGTPLRVRVATARVKILVDLADHMVLGARGGFTDGASIELNGARALACLLDEQVGAVHVCPLEEVALANINATLETALLRHAPTTTPEADALAALPKRPTGGTNISGVRRIAASTPGEGTSDAGPSESLSPEPPEASDQMPAPVRSWAAAGLRFVRAVLLLLALALVVMSAATLWQECAGSEAVSLVDVRSVLQGALEDLSRMVGARDAPPR